MLKSLNFIFLACFLGLAACSEAKVEKAVLTSETLLAVLEKASEQYIEGDFGTPDETVVSQIKAYDAIIYADMVKLRAKAQAGEAITASETISATAALTVFENYLISKNIIKSSDIN